MLHRTSHNISHTRCTGEILVLPCSVSACLSTTVLSIHLHYILFPLLEIECEQGRSPTLGGVGKGGMVEGGQPTVKLPRKLLTNRLVPHGKTPSRASHRIKAPTLWLQLDCWSRRARGRWDAELWKEQTRVSWMIRLFCRVIQHCSWKCQHCHKL